MPSNVWIIAAVSGTGGTTDIYLSGSTRTPYTGSGSPWTAQTTTPIRIAMNSVTGQPWTPHPAQSVPIWQSGPPFRSGRALLDRAYDITTEQIPLQLYATGHDAAVTLLQTLRAALKSGLYGLPPVLAVQWDTATAPVYFEILDGDIAESPRSFNEEAETNMVRATMTITRQPFGGILNTAGWPETAVSTPGTANVTNSSTPLAIPTNLSGDLKHEGQPLNLNIITSAAASKLWAATVWARSNSSPAAAINTTSTSGVTAATVTNVTLAWARPRPRLGVRVLARITSPSANLEVRGKIGFLTTAPYVTSEWRAVGTSSTLVDLVWMRLDPDLIAATGTARVDIVLEARSTNGAAATGTVATIDVLSYETFCQIGGTGISTTDIQLAGFRYQTGRVALPLATPRAFDQVFGPNPPARELPLYGTAPRYVVGTSLYLAWLDASGTHTTSATAKVGIGHAPLWMTIRGAD